MIAVTNKENCCGCGACLLACPKHCISLERDDEGFIYPKVNEDLCVNCGICDVKCPIKINDAISEKNTLYLAVYAKQEQLVKESSSGGVFSVLAESIINKGGVVFGAAFDENWHLRTHKAESIEGLQPLKRAKYVQCETGMAFIEIKKNLGAGRTVLYCSTPCQISGLLSFLGKRYDNLYTVDFICHGVASPKVWQYYLQSFNRPVKSVNFRDKREGWENNSICIEFDSGEIMIERNGDNPYMQAFLSGLSMRPSCFSCKFKGLRRNSNITIGDLWGAKYQCPKGYNEYGTSLVLVHDEKGQYLISKNIERLNIENASMPASIAFNGSINQSTPKPAERDTFLKIYKNADFRIVVDGCKPLNALPLQRPIWRRVASFLKRKILCCR